MNWCAVKSVVRQILFSEVFIALYLFVPFFAFSMSYPHISEFMDVWAPRLFISLMIIFIPIVIYTAFLTIQDKYWEEVRKCNSREKK